MCNMYAENGAHSAPFAHFVLVLYIVNLVVPLCKTIYICIWLICFTYDKRECDYFYPSGLLFFCGWVLFRVMGWLFLWKRVLVDVDLSFGWSCESVIISVGDYFYFIFREWLCNAILWLVVFVSGHLRICFYLLGLLILVTFFEGDWCRREYETIFQHFLMNKIFLVSKKYEELEWIHYQHWCR